MNIRWESLPLVIGLILLPCGQVFGQPGDWGPAVFVQHGVAKDVLVVGRQWDQGKGYRIGFRQCLTHMAGTSLLTDAHGYSYHGHWYLDQNARHHLGLNHLFLDLHVEWHHAGDTPRDRDDPFWHLQYR